MPNAQMYNNLIGKGFGMIEFLDNMEERDVRR
jgi:hypothetical protein